MYHGGCIGVSVWAGGVVWVGLLVCGAECGVFSSGFDVNMCLNKYASHESNLLVFEAIHN